MNASSAAPLYDHNQTTLLSAGATNTVGDGFLVQLIALQGGTNYVLASATIGDDPGEVQNDLSQGFIASFGGVFSVVTAVESNILAGAYGTGTTPLGVIFFDGPTVGAAQYYGIISNASVFVPNPNWENPPGSAVLFEPDWNNASAYKGPRTAALGQNLSGFYADTVNPLGTGNTSGGWFYNSGTVQVEWK